MGRERHTNHATYSYFWKVLLKLCDLLCTYRRDIGHPVESFDFHFGPLQNSLYFIWTYRAHQHWLTFFFCKWLGHNNATFCAEKACHSSRVSFFRSSSGIVRRFSSILGSFGRFLIGLFTLNLPLGDISLFFQMKDRRRLSACFFAWLPTFYLSLYQTKPWINRSSKPLSAKRQPRPPRRERKSTVTLFLVATGAPSIFCFLHLM